MVALVKSPRSKRTSAKRCGLCGKTRNLIKTDCCNNWICDDEHKYVMFSFGRNSCHRNHRKQTLCSYHCAEDHAGNWWECDKCRKNFSTPEYVWFGTNEYNFRKLDNPPEFDPIRCAKCAKVIRIGTDGYCQSGGKYFCEGCSPGPF